jgi:hypothetical protein
MTDKIEVTITGQARAQYAKTIRLTQEEFNELDAMLDSDDRHVRRKAQSRIECMLSGSDLIDIDDFELEEFMAVTE